MCVLITLLIVAAIGTPGTSSGGPSGGLRSSAAPASVSIERSSSSRRYLRLQGLEFALTIEPSCPSKMHVDTISISAADTRKTLRAANIQSLEIIETTLTIPRRQLASLPVAGFCSNDTNGAEEKTIRVHGAYTANISLRCVADNGADDGSRQESIVYATQVLDVTLNCTSGKTAHPDKSEAQDVSSAATER